MSAPRQVKHLDKTTAAYIAGLIDGDGTVTLTHKHKGDNRQLSVSISSTEKALLDYVQTATGVGKTTNKRTSKAHHTPSFVYAIYNRQALTLLKQVTPFLLSYKRLRANLILRDYLKCAPRNGKYTMELLSEKQAFERSVLSIKGNL